MGYRLSKIYTRTGDGGETGLGDGQRVAKDSLRVEAFGTVDELNSVLGMLLAEEPPADVRKALVQVQHDLFDLGSDLCVPGRASMQAADVEFLERVLDAWNAGLEPLAEFILPGGSRAAALAHLARTVCRRAERQVVSLNREEPISEAALRYLNRLSDLLFVMARHLNLEAGVGDVLWQPKRRQKG